MNSFPILLKDFFSGFIVFVVPFVSFMKPSNVRQLSAYDIYLFIISQIIVLLALLVISIVLYLTIMKIFKTRPHSIFLLSCFGYYLLFFFDPIYEFIGLSRFALLCLFLVWLVILVTVLHFQKFGLFFRRSLVIFASINIIFVLVSFIGSYIKDNKPEIQIQSTQSIFTSEEIDLLISTNKRQEMNIYYIILDAMLSLDLAAKDAYINSNLDISEVDYVISEQDEIQIRKLLKKAGLIYIDNSYSSYNRSEWTLASIMEVDYVLSEQNTGMNSGEFFPQMMYQKNKSVPLPELITKLKSKFFWLGPYNQPCVSFIEQPWICIYSNKARNLVYLANNLYFGTPLDRFLIAISKHAKRQRNVDFYMEYLRENKKTNDKKFVFVHQLAPKDYNPTNYAAGECISLVKYIKDPIITDFEGYKATYTCVLKEVLSFMEYISIVDPNAIVVFQSDHGWGTISEMQTTAEDKVLYEAKIFNAIKAPEVCFQKFGKPHSTVNTIRFVLNCSYGLELPYLDIIHYNVDEYTNSITKSIF